MGGRNHPRSGLRGWQRPPLNPKIRVGGGHGNPRSQSGAAVATSNSKSTVPGVVAPPLTPYMGWPASQ
jgi:hypothetical protein